MTQSSARLGFRRFAAHAAPDTNPCLTARFPDPIERLIAASSFSEGTDDDLALVLPEPLADNKPGTRVRLGGLTEDVGVDQLRHSVSVDSDSIGTKKLVAGHASNRATHALIRPAASRTSPVLATVEALNLECLPASMRFCRRISAGSTTP